MKAARGLVNRMRINSSRHHLYQFLQAAAREIPAGALVLDAGSGDGRYAGLFAHARYLATDFGKVDKPYAGIAFFSDLARLPLAGHSFDNVILTQVLEHVPEPRVVLAELCRVMKPGATLYLTVPFFYKEHEVPYDFYRYTRYGLARLLDESGFDLREITWLEGYFGTLSYELETAVRDMPVKIPGAGFSGCLAAPLIALLKPIFMLASLLFSRLDRDHPYKGSGFNKNYALSAVKRGSGQVNLQDAKI